MHGCATVKIHITKGGIICGTFHSGEGITVRQYLERHFFGHGEILAMDGKRLAMDFKFERNGGVWQSPFLYVGTQLVDALDHFFSHRTCSCYLQSEWGEYVSGLFFTKKLCSETSDQGVHAEDPKPELNESTPLLT